MGRIVSRAEMTWLDRRAIVHYGIPEICLMENAGAGTARVAAEMLGGGASRGVNILCGRGNNGGDGFVIARHLANHAAPIRIFVAGGAAAVRPGGAAFTNLEIARRLRLPILDLSPGDSAALATLTAGCGLFVDALFGTGLDRPVAGPDLEVIRAVNAARLPVLSVDVPSGLDADSGEPLGDAIRARRTAALAFAKQGFHRGRGPEHAGEVVVVDIGIPAQAVEDWDREAASRRG